MQELLELMVGWGGFVRGGGGDGISWLGLRRKRKLGKSWLENLEPPGLTTRPEYGGRNTASGFLIVRFFGARKMLGLCEVKLTRNCSGGICTLGVWKAVFRFLSPVGWWSWQ